MLLLAATLMDNRKLIGIGISVALFAALIFTFVWAAKGTTGATASSGMSADGFSSQEEMMKAHHPDQVASTAATPGNGPYQGYNTYEEMMKAHHGSSSGASGSEDGCGGVASGTGAKADFAGTKSDYGITYDDAGYQQLLGMAKSISPTKDQEKLFVGLDILLPCCGVKTLQASDNCECGHHVAMFGLAKMLAQKDYSREQIQSELNKWKQVFYPGGASGTGGC